LLVIARTRLLSHVQLIANVMLLLTIIGFVVICMVRNNDLVVILDDHVETICVENERLIILVLLLHLMNVV